MEKLNMLNEQLRLKEEVPLISEWHLRSNVAFEPLGLCHHGGISAPLNLMKCGGPSGCSTPSVLKRRCRRSKPPMVALNMLPSGSKGITNAILHRRESKACPPMVL